MRDLIIGSDAVAGGMLTRGQLRWNYQQIFPNVYLRNGVPVTVQTRIYAAWLWSRGRAVIAGRAAAALHGSGWIDDDIPIELIWACPRPPVGIIVRAERIRSDEIEHVSGVPVTTAARTALDLGRHLRQLPALQYLDALAAAAHVDPDLVSALIARYPGSRGIARASAVLPLVDGGAQSPQESWLRLIVINAGFPRPQTQIHVTDGFTDAFIDLGWEKPKIGLDYEGEHHRADRARYVHDIGRYELIERQGWADLRVVAEHSPRFVLDRVWEMFRRRGWDPRTMRRDCA